MLARLSAPKPPSDPELAKVLAELAMPIDGAQPVQVVAATVAQLRRRGLVHEPTQKAPKHYTLTDAGQRALRTGFALDKTPLWKDIHKNHLIACALGLEPGSKAALTSTKDASTIANTIVKQHYKTNRVFEIADKMIAELIGLPPGPVTLKRMRAHVLARKAGIGAELPAKKIAVQLAAKIIGQPCTDKKTMSQALIRRWVYEAQGVQVVTTPRAPSGQTTLGLVPAHNPGSGDALLSVVRETIPRIGADGRFGTEKVFVSALWHRIERDSRIPNWSLDRFKRWLITANRDQLLDLARADVVGAMDPKLVAESEIEDLGATFHFVVDRRGNGARGVHAR
jgi:hypothetical protein